MVIEIGNESAVSQQNRTETEVLASLLTVMETEQLLCLHCALNVNSMP